MALLGATAPAFAHLPDGDTTAVDALVHQILSADHAGGVIVWMAMLVLLGLRLRPTRRRD
jgi:hypothetical protein